MIRKFLTALSLFIFLLWTHPALAQICHVGDHASVLWGGKWWPATVIQVGSYGDKCKIHYTGYGNNWDEWVGPSRIRIAGGPAAAVNVGGFGVGNAVMVKWKGRWWPAHVMQVSGNKLFIHYDGYGSNWDEWVGPGRYRMP